MKLLKNLAILLILTGCLSPGGNETVELKVPEKAFRDYWFAGKAELNRFHLKQARYGEIHEGNAVLIFVTEDFLKTKQVKSDRGNSGDAAAVLKLNFTRKFLTGIYPYSMMNSIFTPIYTNGQDSFKAAFSSQEWCGHTFFQLNNRGGHFSALGRSYFQREGDVEYSLKKALLEDEIWNKIRFNPATLPLGEVDMIPALHYARLRHTPLKVEKVFLEVGTVMGEDGNESGVVSIAYLNLERKVDIFFEKEFPYHITGWKEVYKSGFGPDARELVTEATRTHQVMLDYWSKHNVADRELRKELGLLFN